jgi:hypothetical protein
MRNGAKRLVWCNVTRTVEVTLQQAFGFRKVFVLKEKLPFLGKNSADEGLQILVESVETAGPSHLLKMPQIRSPRIMHYSASGLFEHVSTGFCSGAQLANSMIKTGTARKVALISTISGAVPYLEGSYKVRACTPR